MVSHTWRQTLKTNNFSEKAVRRVLQIYSLQHEWKKLNYLIILMTSNLISPNLTHPHPNLPILTQLYQTLPNLTQPLPKYPQSLLT